MGAEQSQPAAAARPASRPAPRPAPSSAPPPTSAPVALIPGGPPILPDSTEASLQRRDSIKSDSPSAAEKKEKEAAEVKAADPSVVPNVTAARSPAEVTRPPAGLPSAAVRAASTSSAPASPRDVELQPMSTSAAASFKSTATAAPSSARPARQEMPAVAQQPAATVVTAPPVKVTSSSAAAVVHTVVEDEKRQPVVAVSIPLVALPAKAIQPVQPTAVPSVATKPQPTPVLSAPGKLTTVTSLQPVSALAHPLAAREEKKEEKEEAKVEEQKTAAPVLPVPAAVEMKEQKTAEQASRVDVQQPEVQRAAGQSSSVHNPQRPPRPPRSFFQRFFLCDCGSAEPDFPSSPSPDSALPRPPPVNSSEPVPSPSVVISAPQPVPPVSQEIAPAPSPVPAPIPAPVAQPMVAAVPAKAASPSAPAGSPVAAAAAPVSNVLIAPPVALKAEDEKQLPSASLPPGESVSEPTPDQPVQLMHPVYSHLPLLRVDPSLLHQFPPHRPPVPDPSELRAFAEMRTIPMPKSLQAPYLLSSLVDEFIPSSTSYLAFQNSTDWSYSLYLDILNACKQTGEKFFDSQFAPSPESLFAHYEPRFKLTESDSLYSENGSVGVQETGTRWCRASEMSVPVNSFSSLFSSWELMHPHIQASDVKQGGLGTCYFVASVCALCDRDPDFIRSLFLTPDYSVQGVYQIRLCRNSAWTVVTIDDFLPCLSSSNTFRFTSACDNQLWPALLEKAYAKLYHSYRALDGGLPHEVLSDITGCPAFRVDMFPHYDEAMGVAGGPGTDLRAQSNARSAPLQFVDAAAELDVLWLQLMEWKRRGHIFCATCSAKQWEASREDEYRQRYAQWGLVFNHCYSLLDVLEEDGVRLLKLRNPWGRFVWRGRFSRGPERLNAKRAAEELEAARLQQERIRAEQVRQAQARAARPKSLSERMKGAMKAIVDVLDEPPLPGPNAHPSRAAAPKVREDKGLFWMEWSDFCQHFSEIFVCQFGDRWQEMRIADSFGPPNPAAPHHTPGASTPGQSVAMTKSASSPHYASSVPMSHSATPPPSSFTSTSMFELLVSAPTCVFLTLAQPDKRGEPPGVSPQPTYQPLGLYVLQSTNATSALSANKFSFVQPHWQLIAYHRPYPDRSVTSEVLLPSITSRYLLLPEAWLYGATALSYVLTIHADRPFYCRRLPLLPPALLSARLLAPPAGNLNSSQMTHYHCRVQEICPTAYLCTYSIPGGQAYIVQNHNAREYLHLCFDITESVRVLGSRANAGGVCYDVVPPQSEQLVMVVSGMRRSLPHEKQGEVKLRYWYVFRSQATLQKFALNIAHHPPISNIDYHLPRRIVATRRV